MNTKTFETAYIFNLQLFADGAGGEGGAATAGTAPVAEGQEAAVDSSLAAEQTETAPVDLEAEFNDLIKGKYKAQYATRVKNAVNDRFKGTDAKIQKQEAFAESLADRLGIADPNDYESMEKAIDELKKSGLQERAYQNGRSEEDQAKIESLEATKRRYDNMIERQQREQNIRQQVDDWMRQGEALKQQFPAFDLNAEYADNPRFSALLGGGSTVEEAYRATHPELVVNAMKYTAEQVEKSVVNDIRANGLRPAENGTSAQAPVNTSFDLNKLTGEQINQYIELARQGKKVRFS